MKPLKKRLKKKLKKLQKPFCPNCTKRYDGVFCKKCGFDTGFDPNWDLGN